MNISELSASPGSRHTLLQLKNAFWASKAMEAWRRVPCDTVRVSEIPRFRDYSDCLFGDGPPVPPELYIEFAFVVARYGDETWVAVVSEERVVVAPFQLPPGGPADVPYFPEELACSPSR